MAEKEYILVTGGAGFIGSHTVVELLQEGYEVIVIDNLSNSSEEALHRIEKITSKKIHKFYKIDLVDEPAVQKVFDELKTSNIKISAVIHFAGLKAVGESTQIPLTYYDTNLRALSSLLRVMKDHKIRNLVFSSSATVYGDIAMEDFPKGGLKEDAHTQSNNPYGRTKLFQEWILKDVYASDKTFWNFEILRYFNPVGAHKSGLIGEDPRGIPNNLMPFITQVAVGQRPELSVFGTDYPTRDGTGIRDYIHVVDLAKGHTAAVKHAQTNPGLAIFNLGCGTGYTVLEVVSAFEKACGKPIPKKLVARRPGDVAIYLANVDKANKELNWRADIRIDEMCDDSWRWQSQNPKGYKQ